MSIFDDKWNVTFRRYLKQSKKCLIPRPFLLSLSHYSNVHRSIGYVKGLCQSYHVNYNSFKYLHSNWSRSLAFAFRVIHAWQHTSNRWVRMFGRKFVLELAFFSISFYVNDCFLLACRCYYGMLLHNATDVHF